MQQFWETIFGLSKGFLSRDGEFSRQFHPQWPWQDVVGAGTWNFVLGAAGIALIVYVYRREGRSKGARIGLGILRGLLLAFVLMLLNRPVLTLTQSRTEPSVLAIMVDDSISMRVRDGAGKDQSTSRLDAAIDLLSGADQKLLNDLRKQHIVKLYRFSQDANPIATTQPALDLRAELKAEGQHTQVLRSVRTVLDDLQGQRLAGVVVLTDGRETPAGPIAEALAPVKDYNVKVYPIAVGSEQAPQNIELQTVNVQDSAFKGDLVNVKATVRGTGYQSGHVITLQAKDKKTGALITSAGLSGEARVTLQDDKPVEVELPIKVSDIGTLDLNVEAVKQSGELDDEDNLRTAQLAVLDAKIGVLYVDGYPRWEYRYIKNEMIRDATVDISCLLTSADPSFAQEGDKPIRRFPESIQEMMEYDVVVFGDVEPRQFTDAQLQLVADFVAKRGGGFGMIAGPRWSPAAFRNTAIEPLLPVALAQNDADDPAASVEGFRPMLTKDGESSSIFRFFTDKVTNEAFLRDKIQPIFWYRKGVVSKPGVGEVLATHPTDTASDGRKSPLLVLGRFGAGRTLFSGIDDSWRWRFYTGESVFDTYWVQQLRYLARSKKLGQRRLTLTSQRPSYELGQQVRVNLRVLDPQLLQQLPEQVRVEIQDATGAVVAHENLVRQEGQPESYVLNFTADRVGRFTVKLPPIAGGVEAMDLPLEVTIPRLELVQPQVDRTLLSRLASETLGQTVAMEEARAKLPTLIPSAAKIIPIETSEPLWDAPLALVIFVLLITVEWVVRKMYGMV